MTVLAAALLGAAVWLWLPRAVGSRVRSVVPHAGSPPRRARSTSTTTILASVIGAAGAFLLIGGFPGVVLAIACGVVVPRAARRLEPRAVRDRRARIAAQAPLVADLLAATLAAGSPTGAALAAVCQAIGDPARQALRPVVAALDLGADARTAWHPFVNDDSLGAIASAMMRSAESGAPLSSVLARIADDLRRQHQVSVEVAARAAGVKAVLPLAACFLPAFVLLGIVPVIAALGGGILS